MRSSHATWVLVALVAGATCMQTGCGFTRLGRNVSNISMERPRLLSWRRNKRDTEVASNTRPPSSSIPPAGDTDAGSASRNFPSEPAPGGNYDYARTDAGSGNYENTSGAGDSYDRSGGYNDNYVASGGSEAGAQRGFYNPDSYAGNGSQYGDTASRGGGYDSYNGSSRDYGPSYGNDTRDYEQLADRRGDDSSYGRSGGSTYGDTSGGSQYGGSQYGGSQYGDSQYGGSQYGDSQYGSSQYDGSQYGDSQYGATQTPASYNSGSQDSRHVSPGGAGSADDYRSPAQGSYNDTYNGGGYDSTYGAGSSTGGTAAPAGGSSSPRWFPGSTKNVTPYDQQQQLSPPTNTGWGN